MEGLCCQMPSGRGSGWIRPLHDSQSASSALCIRWRNPLSGMPSHLSTRQDISLSKIQIASDYSDSMPYSSSYMGSRGYHHLEEVKENRKSREKILTAAEMARTVVEANNNALLIFPGMVHYEPHGHISWAEFQYVFDDFGDIFVEIFDDENILLDRGASNPVNVLIGMDFPIYGKNSGAIGYNVDDSGSFSGDNEDENEDEIGDIEVSSLLLDWGMAETMRHVHPLYFAKYLTKVAHTKNWKWMNHPSSGLSIMGYLRPAFTDEESYLRRLFHGEDSDGYISDWKEKGQEGMAAVRNLIDGEVLKFNSKEYGGSISSTLYRLEIMRIELFSIYGDKLTVSLQDFQEAEPDILVHSASRIIENLNEYDVNCETALKALCRKKKGLHVEVAKLIGVDSLGIDVRVFFGVEAQTLRFSFNTRAITEDAAEKKIRRMLFPRCFRKNTKAPSYGLRDFKSH